MTRCNITIWPLIVLLLLMPLQGQARTWISAAPMPCPMTHQQGMQGMVVPSASEQADSRCESHHVCGMECQHCAGCVHYPAGISVPPLALQAIPAQDQYTPLFSESYTSIPLLIDHPPPRLA